MNSIALRRNDLAGVLASLSVDDMAWAMKFLADKMTFRLRTKEHVGTADSEVLERNKTERFLERVCGTWVDDKDADEMVRDIYDSRVSKDYSDLEKIFNE